MQADTWAGCQHSGSHQPALLHAGVIYVANFLFMYQCGIVVVHKHMKIVLMDGLDVARAYTLSWRGVLDIISFLPFIYLVGVTVFYLNLSLADILSQTGTTVFLPPPPRSPSLLLA